MKQGSACTLEYIATKRISNMQYLRQVFEGTVPWMETVDIPVKMLRPTSIDAMRMRTRDWFHFGMCLGDLLETKRGNQLVGAVMDLITFYSTQHGSGSKATFKVSNAKIGMASPPTSMALDDCGPMRQNDNSKDKQTSDSATIELQECVEVTVKSKSNQLIDLFAHRQNVPCSMDYILVVIGLLDTLAVLYQRFMDDSADANGVVKVDGELKHRFFGKLSLEINEIAEELVKEKIFQMFETIRTGTEEDDGLLANFTIDQWKC